MSEYSVKINTLNKYELEKYLKEIDASQNEIKLITAINDSKYDDVKYIINNTKFEKDIAMIKSYVLYFAIQRNNIEMVKLLLESGADPNYMDIESVLSLAAALGSLPIVKLLVSYGADLNFIGIDNNNVLHFALLCDHNNLDVIKYLVFYGADFNLKDRFNNTVLHKSVMNGGEDIIEYFLSLDNIDINATNNLCLSAYDCTFIAEEATFYQWKDRDKALRIRKLFEANQKFDRKYVHCKEFIDKNKIRFTCEGCEKEAVGK